MYLSTETPIEIAGKATMYYLIWKRRAQHVGHLTYLVFDAAAENFNGRELFVSDAG
jgi:hypothetical protein